MQHGNLERKPQMQLLTMSRYQPTNTRVTLHKRGKKRLKYVLLLVLGPPTSSKLKNAFET
jgi:hypothetical protein